MVFIVIVCKMSSQLRVLTSSALKKRSASVIFLHGSGDSGHGIKEWLDSVLDGNFQFPHINVIFPSAPGRLYTPTKTVMPVWFDRIQISPYCKEDLQSIDQMCCSISKLVDQEVASGVPLDRIIIGGFSMGGALSFHCAYRFFPNVAGVFALSSFLNENSAVYEAISGSLEKKLPPLFQTHGVNDSLVLPDWAKMTNSNLAKLGIETSFQLHPRLYHEFNRKIILDLMEWITKLLPE